MFKIKLVGNSMTNLALIVILCVIFGCASPSGAERTDVWVAIRSDEQAGAGTKSDPFNGRGPDGLNRLFDMLVEKYGENLTVNFESGTYFGQKMVNKIKNGWQIRGAGMDKTIFKTYPNPNGVEVFGFRCFQNNNCGWYDITFDFNLDKMRKANRVFVWYLRGKPEIRYYHSEKLKDWVKGRNYYENKYRRSFTNACLYQGVEYIAVKNIKGELSPPQDRNWTRMNDMAPDRNPVWNEGTTYKVNDTVKYNGESYICLMSSHARPDENPKNWGKVDQNRFDPRLYTHAVFCGDKPPRGNLTVERVRGTNTNGSLLFNRENFVFGLNGDNCLIKDCVVDNVRGDYSTEIIIACGSGSRVAGCKVYGNGYNMSYGGWGVFDGVFESNYCQNGGNACNFDSKVNRNVTFRNNEFRACRLVGILISMAGGRSPNYGNAKMLYQGREVDMGLKTMTNIVIEENLIEMQDCAPFGAAQLQVKGLLSGIVRNNRFKKTPGNGIARGVGVFQGANVKIENNILDPKMYISIEQATNVTTLNNCYPNGEQVKLTRPSTPKARINIEADFELIPSGVSAGGFVKNRAWGENRKNGIWARSHDTLGIWTPFELTFIPSQSGEVELFLAGQHWMDPDSGEKPVPGWVCFDNLEIKGATLLNTDFEDIKNRKASFWTGPGKIINNPARASSGSNYALVWLKTPCTQCFRVKKDQAVMIKMMVRQGDGDESTGN